MKVHYESFVELPELARVCLECERDDCEGICDSYRNAYRAYIGLPPLRVPKPKRQPRERRERKCNLLGGRKNRLLEANGEAHTLNEWSEITGIPYRTLYMRMSRLGMSVQEAMNMVSRKCNRVMVTYNGETHSLTEWAEITGLGYRCLQTRIKRGMSAEEALTTPKLTPKECGMKSHNTRRADI